VSGTLVNHYDCLSIQNTVGVIHSQLEKKKKIQRPRARFLGGLIYAATTVAVK
jgi:hypothetical protein